MNYFDIKNTIEKEEPIFLWKETVNRKVHLAYFYHFLVVYSPNMFNFQKFKNYLI